MFPLPCLIVIVVERGDSALLHAETPLVFTLVPHNVERVRNCTHARRGAGFQPAMPDVPAGMSSCQSKTRRLDSRRCRLKGRSTQLDPWHDTPYPSSVAMYFRHPVCAQLRID